MTIGLVFQWSAVSEKKRLHHFLIIASKTTCYVAEGRELHPNLIEILWRFVKYQWLPWEAYLSLDHLEEKLWEVFLNVGKKFIISFG